MSKVGKYFTKIITFLNKNKKYYLVYLIFNLLMLTRALSRLNNEWTFAHIQQLFILYIILGYFPFVFSFTLPKLLLKHTNATTILNELFTTAKQIFLIYIASILITMLFSTLLANAITFYEVSKYGTLATLMMRKDLPLIDTYILSSLNPIKNLLENLLGNTLFLYAPFFYSLKGKNTFASVGNSASFFFKNLPFSVALTLTLTFIAEFAKIIPSTTTSIIWILLYLPINSLFQIVTVILVLFYFQDHTKTRHDRYRAVEK